MAYMERLPRYDPSEEDPPRRRAEDEDEDEHDFDLYWENDYERAEPEERNDARQ